MVAMYQARRDADVERSAVAATDRLLGLHAGPHVGSAAASRGDDLLSQPHRRRDRGRNAFGEDELVTTAILLLNAGHEATVHAIGNGIKALLEEGVDPGAAFADAASTAAHVEELLRFDAPLHLFTRYALEDVDFGGHPPAEGGDRSACCSAPPTAIRRASPIARSFRPGARSPNPHVSFGAGIHFCVGAPLARLELQVALPILFRRLPRLRLAETPR